MQYRCNRYYSIEDILGIWASLLRAFPDPRNVGFEQRVVAEGMIINVREVYATTEVCMLEAIIPPKVRRAGQRSKDRKLSVMLYMSYFTRLIATHYMVYVPLRVTHQLLQLLQLFLFLNQYISQPLLLRYNLLFRLFESVRLFLLHLLAEFGRLRQLGIFQ